MTSSCVQQYMCAANDFLSAQLPTSISKMCCLQVEVDPIDKGALRVARSADQHDVLLCEELKYLYTALTRAKNNVIIFDSNTAKRAPFFNYLRRLGMAQYVSR
jgi:hypothetical protein